MSDKLLLIRITTLLLLTSATLIVWFPNVSFSQKENYLTVKFFDVGQGDSIHVETPDGYELLIDGGAGVAVLRELAKERSFFDKEIDIVIATHPDTDHVAGLVDVLERYDVNMILESKVEHEAEAARAFARAASAEGAQIITAQAGQTIQLGASTVVRVLSPQGDTTNWQSNNASVIIQLVYGDIEFMLTGDASSSIEDYLVGIYGNSLKSDVLKLGHHGSKTSTSELFLKTVQPEFAVVSAGANNRYGHPHADVINRVEDSDASVLSTAESGTLVFQSDGKKVWVK